MLFGAGQCPIVIVLFEYVEFLDVCCVIDNEMAIEEMGFVLF